jgi:hypothetical protein
VELLDSVKPPARNTGSIRFNDRGILLNVGGGTRSIATGESKRVIAVALSAIEKEAAIIVVTGDVISSLPLFFTIAHLRMSRPMNGWISRFSLAFCPYYLLLRLSLISSPAIVARSPSINKSRLLYCVLQYR